MQKRTIKKRMIRKPSRAKASRRKRRGVHRADGLKTVIVARIRWIGALSRSLNRRLMRFLFAGHPPHPLRGLHPYMRTMFLSLAIGSILVFWSAIYYVEVSAATKPLIAGEAVTFAQASQLADTPFVELVEALEAQKKEVVVRPLPREYLRLKAEEKGYDYELLNQIAFCESGWRMIKNRRSTAFGYFQIIDGTERVTPQYADGLRKDDPYANIDMALHLYETQGTLPWLASRRCWAR